MRSETSRWLIGLLLSPLNPVLLKAAGVLGCSSEVLTGSGKLSARGYRSVCREWSCFKGFLCSDVRRTEICQTSGAKLTDGDHPESFRFWVIMEEIRSRFPAVRAPPSVFPVAPRYGPAIAVLGRTVGGRVEPGRAQSAAKTEKIGEINGTL